MMTGLPCGDGRDGQGAAHAVIAAVKVEHVNLFRIGENPVFAIEHDGVAFDAVPERAHDLQMFLRLLIARIVLDQLIVAPVGRLVFRPRATAFQAILPW